MNPNELRELQERAHQIRQLQQTSGWELLADYVKAQADAKLRRLIAGRAKTVEEYRGDAGWIQGATFVLNAADELDKMIAGAAERRADGEAEAA